MSNVSIRHIYWCINRHMAILLSHLFTYLLVRFEGFLSSKNVYKNYHHNSLLDRLRCHALIDISGADRTNYMIESGIRDCEWGVN